MPVQNKIHQGGMFRCCIATLLMFEGEEHEGQIIRCSTCRDGQMKLMNGVWRYVREEGKPPIIMDDHGLMCPANGKPERREDCNCGETDRMKREGLI